MGGIDASGEGRAMQVDPDFLAGERGVEGVLCVGFTRRGR